MGSASGIRAGKAFVEVYADKTRLVKDLKGIGQDMRNFGAGIAASGTRVMGLGAAITAPLALAIRSFIKAGDELDKMSQRLGASVEFLSALSYAASLSGTEIGALEVGFRRMQRTAYDASRGLSTAVDAFDDLGVTIVDASGNLKPTEDLFMESAAALAAVENNIKKAALATVIFGRAGTMLLPMLSDGAEGLAAMMEEARQLGLVMSTQDATAAAMMNDAFDRLRSAVKMTFFQIGAALADTGIVDTIRNVIVQVKEWIQANGNIVRTVATVGAGLVAGGAAMFAFGKAISAAGSLILGMFTASKFAASGLSILTTGFSILTNPLGIAVAGIAAISAGLLYLARDTKAVEYVRSTILGYTDDIASMFRSLVSEAMTTWQGITDAVSAGRLDLAWAVVTETMKLAWVSMVNSFYDIIEPFRVWWSDTTFGLASVFVDGLASIESAWVSMLSVMRKLWAEFIASGFIENMLVRFNNVFGPILERLGISLNEGAIRSLSKDQRDKLPGTYANIDAETATRQADIESRRRASQGALGDDMAAAARRRQADIDKRGDDLERAKAARDAAVEESRRAAENAKAEREARKPFIPGEFGDLASGKGKVAGTFSASEAANMGGRSTLDKMLAEFRKGTNLQGRLVFENKETNRRLGALNMELQP